MIGGKSDAGRGIKTLGGSKLVKLERHASYANPTSKFSLPSVIYPSDKDFINR